MISFGFNKLENKYINNPKTLLTSIDTVISGGIHSLAIHLRCSYLARINDSNDLINQKKKFNRLLIIFFCASHTNQFVVVEIHQVNLLRIQHVHDYYPLLVLTIKVEKKTNFKNKMKIFTAICSFVQESKLTDLTFDICTPKFR